MPRRLRAGLALLALLTAAAAGADEISDALSGSQQVLRSARDSQQRINKLDDEARALQEKRRTAEFQAQQVGAYARQIEGLAADEERKRADLEAQLARAVAIGRDLQPLMQRMVAELDAAVENGAPFLLKERRERVAQLKSLIADPARGVTDKYRRLIETYRTEVDYGHSLGAEDAVLDLGGKRESVTLLRVGRVGLYYLTVDGRAGAWDAGQHRWHELNSEDTEQVRHALPLARGEAPPELLVLPVAAARVAP